MSAAKQDLFKMAGNDEEQYNTLLSYYRSKIGEFDKERFEWLQRLEEIRLSYEERHQLQWELNKRKEEIMEVQRSLSEAKVMLFEERQLNLRLTRENDTLKCSQLEDRRRLLELYGNPLEEQVVLQKDIRPNTTQKFISNELSLNYNKTGTQPLRTTNPLVSKSIVKTIYLPNEQMNAVALENHNLKHQLDIAQQLLSQQSAALRQEIDHIRNESEGRRSAEQIKLREMMDKVQRLEKHNVEMNKDFYGARLQWSESERQLQEENDIASTQEIQSKVQAENKATLQLVEKRSDEYNKKFKRQANQKEENLSILKEQYAQVQQIYVQKIRQLEESLSKLVDRYQQLEKRRVLEIEGFKVDIRRLNQRLKDYDQQYVNQKLIEKSDIQKYQEEAEKLKEEALRQTQAAYGASNNNQTKKKQKKPQKQKKHEDTQKRESKQLDEQIYNQIDDFNEDYNDQESSLPIQDLEDIQKQLEELESKMDMARRQ